MTLLVSTDLYSIWIDPPPATVVDWCQQAGVRFTRSAAGDIEATWHGEGPLAEALVHLVGGADDGAVYRVTDILLLLKGVPLMLPGEDEDHHRPSPTSAGRSAE